MKILFDNYPFKKECRSLWGFSIFLEEYKLLFDTGSNGRVLLENMSNMKVNPKDIKYVFISHFHWDHIWGIDSLLELNDQIILFVPNSFSEVLVENLKTLTKDVIVVSDEKQKLFGDLYSTGVLGKDTPEQSLVIDDEYPKVITGCGHYGIENIVKIAKWIINKDIKMAIGGFHMLEKSENEIKQSINKLKKIGVESALPTHCSGDKAIELFKDSFKDRCFLGGVCREIII